MICTDYHRHILFPTDSSDTAERAFQYVEEIVQAAETEGATLIVMGTQGRGFLGEMLLGSVSHQVARRTHVPMLLVPPHAAVPGRTIAEPQAAEDQENGHAAVS